jgi:hypothetical protein
VEDNSLNATEVTKHYPCISWISVFALLLVGFLCSPQTALADNCSVDSCVSYSVTGSLQDGGSLSGSFLVDESNGTIASSSFLADGTSFSSGLYYIYQFPTPSGPDVFNAFSTGGGELSIQFGPFSLTGLPNSFSLAGTTHIDPVSGAWVDLNSGEAIASPEPASWLLMLVGALAIGFLGVRRDYRLGR